MTQGSCLNALDEPRITGGQAKDTRKKPKRKQQRRKKRHRNDVKTDQDMDAIVGYDDSLSENSEGIIDTFGGASCVVVDEFDELVLGDLKDGSTKVEKEKKTKKNKKNDIERGVRVSKETKTKKVKQALKLLEKVERKEATIGTENGKKTTRKQKGADSAQDKTKHGKSVRKKKAMSAVVQASITMNDKRKKEMKASPLAANQQLQSKENDVSAKKSGTSGTSKKSSRKDARGNGRVTYTDYYAYDRVLQGLEMGRLLQGKLRVNPMYRLDGYITVNGLSIDVLVKGMQDRNRALDGDLVAIRLHPESQWKMMNNENERSGNFASEPMSSNAGVDQETLHSLWLPSVRKEQCFLKRTFEETSSVDTLKETITRLDEHIKESCRRPTATVVFILAHGNANGFIGSLEAKTKVNDLNLPLPSNDSYAYFNADDLRLPRHIRIPRLQLPDEFVHRPLLYSKTMLCICRVKAWSTKHQSPMGEFVKTVGEYTGIETGISAILSKHGLQAHTLDFDSTILDELDAKYGTSGEKWEIPKEEVEKRRDFRNAQIFSIDPYNARDLDDALHIRALDDTRTRFEIGVHIADVTHFIDHESILDREARSRATSVYLANRVLPMLPRILCEKLCSLQPQVDRLAFSVLWQMNVDGTLVDGVEPWFGKSIIRSCCKLDYGSAQKMLDGAITEESLDEWEESRRPIPGANPTITNTSVIQGVKDLWSIGEKRRAARFKTGAVSLNDVKLVFSLDAKGNPTRYGSYELKNSNRLVEEYMLLANYLVAQQLLRAHGPLAFLRHHPPPVSRSMDQTMRQLDESGITLDGRSTKQLTESMESIRKDRGETIFAVVQALVIKPMKPAEYMVAGNGASPDSSHHFALNIPYYTHFTSPIRRYADVVVHRLLQESLTGTSFSNDEAFDRGAIESRMVEFTSVAQHCNEKKMASKNAEKECDKVFLCAHVKHHGDVDVTGVVLSMGRKSFTVYIVELGLEERFFLQEMHLTGYWNEQTSQLSIVLPAPRKAKTIEKDNAEDLSQNALDCDTSKTATLRSITLSFMKQLCMRMSTTKKMPLALTFSVIGEKS
ncbi:hypothetical protein PsorP6_008860 [Peronosclerospora sorghi]|uniref:Uncharacterized protein n=1 Tax=Peronosclerospora sorghi TaxID=230839 RepID=A0ACC0VYH5_9STRA|nr:hypothetical protein PsorP6_008860 [Peronosclerospora sorghi]